MICPKCGANDDDGYFELDDMLMCTRCKNIVDNADAKPAKTKTIEFAGKKYRSLHHLVNEKSLVEYSLVRKRLKTNKWTLEDAITLPANMEHMSKQIMLGYLVQQNKYTHKELAHILKLKNTRQVKTMLDNLKS